MREGWARKSLGDLLKAGILAGIQDGNHGNDHPKSSEYVSEGIPFVMARDLSGGRVNIDTCAFLPRSRADRLRIGFAKTGDILLSHKGTVGAIARVQAGFPYMMLTPQVTYYRIKDTTQLDPDFLEQAFRSEEFQSRIHKISAQSTRAYVGITEQKRLVIPLPPLPEQRKIATILRTWDEALEKLNALRAVKAMRHVGLTHTLVFGGMQLEEFRESNEATSYRWYQLPAAWGCKPIGGLAVEISERNTDGDALDVLSCSKHEGFVRSLEYFKKQVFSANLSGYKKIWRGDFGFPSNHVEEGSIGLQNLTEIGVVSPIYTVFRFDPAQILGEYAFAVLKTEVYRYIFEVSTSASVDRRGSLRWKEFARLPFPIPPLAEQEAIAEVLNTSKSEIDVLDSEIEALTRQKRGLMQKLLTGEWRIEVSDDDEAAV